MHELRPPGPEDVPAIVDVLNFVPRTVHGVEDESEAEIRRWFDAPDIDVERDVRVAVDQNGVIVGYADIQERGDDHSRLWLDARVHPETGSSTLPDLIRWGEERARATAAPGALLRAFIDTEATNVKEALEAAGYRLIRHSYRMSIDLDGSPPTPAWPAGIALRAYEDGDAPTVYEVQDECFADSWEHAREPFEVWAHWHMNPDDFDPTLWFLATDGAELAGIALCRVHNALPETGWVDILGVRRPWRKRGLGRALLEHSFAEFQRRGYKRVGLGVDAESLTGAHRLYESAGMRVVRRFDIHEKELAAGTL